MNHGYEIFTGRFQPFHIGHYLTVKHLAEISDRKIVIGIVNPDPAHPIAGDQQKDWHRFEKSMNPLNFWERQKLIWLALADSEFKQKVEAVVPIARPSVNMGRANQFLPPQPRRFVLSQKWNDEVEAWKANRYQKLGDDTLVISYRDLPPLSTLGEGSVIRAMIQARLPNWGVLIPEKSLQYLCDLGFEERVLEEPVDDPAEFVREFIQNHPNRELAAQLLVPEPPLNEALTTKRKDVTEVLIDRLTNPDQDLGATRIVILPVDLAREVEKMSTHLFVEGSSTERVSLKEIDKDNLQVEISDQTCRLILRNLRG